MNEFPTPHSENAGKYLGCLILLAGGGVVWWLPYLIAGVLGVAVTAGSLSVFFFLGFVVHLNRGIKEVLRDHRS